MQSPIGLRDEVKGKSEVKDNFSVMCARVLNKLTEMVAGEQITRRRLKEMERARKRERERERERKRESKSK